MTGARATMTHRALIERDGATGVDAHNNPNSSAWSTHLAALPCRAWYGTGTGAGEREVVDGRKTALVEKRTMIVPLGTDVTNADRVASISDRLGAELFAGPAKIEAVGRRADHLVLTIEHVS